MTHKIRGPKIATTTLHDLLLFDFATALSRNETGSWFEEFGARTLLLNVLERLSPPRHLPTQESTKFLKVLLEQLRRNDVAMRQQRPADETGETTATL